MKTCITAAAIAAGFLLSSTVTAQASCVQMEGNMVVNYCGYRVMGNYKGSDGSWGGFGPISPGKREGTSKRKDAAWEVSFCNYDAWVAGTCRPKRPQDM